MLYASISYGYDSDGTGWVSINSVYPASGATYNFAVDGVNNSGGIGSLPLRRTLAAGAHTAQVTNYTTGESSPLLNFTLTPVSTGGDLRLTGLVFFAFDEGEPTPSVEAQIYWQTSSGAGLAKFSLDPTFANSPSFSIPGTPFLNIAVQPNETYTVYVRDEDDHQAAISFTAPVPGCIDPDADNYNPDVTLPFSTFCTFSPRLLVGAYEELAPVGAPLRISLSSAERARVSSGQETPAPAVAYISLENYGGESVTLTVNGYVLQAGPITQPGRFNDVETLLEALSAIPMLTARYKIQQSQDYEVRLRAKQIGTADNLTVISSDSDAISVYAVPGVNRYRSQDRAEWGCWLEVYAVPDDRNFGPNVNIGNAELAGRLELYYRVDNSYSFDIAPLLRPYVGHSYPDANGRCADRLVAYYLRYGERYADAPGGLRRDRARASYVSPTTWALEAMEVTRISALDSYLLTARPSPWRVRPTGPHFPLLVLFNQTQAGYIAAVVNARNWRGDTDEQSTLLVNAAGEGGVYRPGAIATAALWATLRDDLWLPAGERLTTGIITTNAEDIFVPAVEFTGYDDTSPQLHFVNRQGGIDIVLFDGSQEDDLKRTASTFANEVGTQQLSATAALPARIYTRPLTRAVWAWLRVELAVSPSVWLELTPGADLVPVRATDLDAPADHNAGQYSVSVVLETPQVEGLTN